MKALLVLLVIGGLIYVVAAQKRATSARDAEARHEVAIGMTRAQVQRCLGKPLRMTTTADIDLWDYSDRSIAFTGEKVTALFVGASSLPVLATSLPAAAASPSGASAAPTDQQRPREVTYLPQLHRAVEHDPTVSASTAAGLNAFHGPLPGRDPVSGPVAAATPQKFTSSSALSQPARR